MSAPSATQLSVSASPAAHADSHVAQVIASLPVSLRPAPSGGQLVAVAGAPGWTERAAEAISAGALGVVVDDPVVEDVEALRQRARTAGVPVVVDTTWAHDPAVAASAQAFAAADGAESLLEARVDVPVGADLDRVLLAQLALVRAAVAPVARLRIARWSSRGYDALADLASGSTAAVGAICSDALAPAARLRIVRPRTAVSVHLPAPTSAVPGTVRTSGPDGSTLLPTEWETPHRVAWRRAHALATAGGATEDLDHLAQDLRVIREAPGRES